MALSPAQDASETKGEKVRFSTVDGVEIQGMFYPGARRSSPTVMMLHALGEDSRKKSWVALAESLNKEGASVLTFDFRGQGQSTSIEPTVFWRFPRNSTSVKGSPKKESIEYKAMSQDYYPVLVNDIAAAKAFLDGRNDTGVCNSANLIVLGAETGATLGSIWLSAEWHRYAFTPANPLMGIQAAIAPLPDGKKNDRSHLAEHKSKLGSRVVRLSSVLDVPGRQYATPMAFMYSKEDAPTATLAKATVKAIKGTKKDEKYSFTDSVPIDGGKLSGAGLLQKSLGTDDAIVAYVKSVAEAKGNEWEERDFRKTLYIWRLGSTQIAAKKMGMNLLEYNTYEMFLR